MNENIQFRIMEFQGKFWPQFLVANTPRWHGFRTDTQDDISTPTLADARAIIANYAETPVVIHPYP